MHVSFRSRLLASTLFIGAAAISTPAWAQEDDQANQENPVSAEADPTNAPTEANEADTDDGEIIVTGSRIARRDLTSSSPLAVIQDEEFKLSGQVNVENVLNTLPQVIPGSTGFDNNPGGGVATVDLRGLGTNENLVLVNGRRYVFFDTTQIVDINTIPAFLIDSVDVVTGGASAIYGSDAVAGVINFRLRNDLDGFEAGGQMSLTEEGDGRRLNAHIALGSGFADDRGHVTVYGEYYERKGVFAEARDFARQSFTDDGEGGFDIGGSATTDRGRIAIAGTQVIAAVCRGTTVVFSGFGGDQNCDGTVSTTEAATALARGPGAFGTPLGANFATPGSASVFNFPGDLFNYAPTNYLQVPQERFLLGGYGDYEISDAVTAYTEVTFINNRVDNELAPTPVTGTTLVGLAGNQGNVDAATFALLQQLDANETAINAANAARCAAAAAANPPVPCTFTPLPGAGVVSLGVNRRIVETGSRATLDERNAFRALVGVKGPVIGDFNYDAYYFYARTRNANIQEGNISRSAFNAGVLNGTVNVFGPGTISPAALAAISITAQNTDISVLQVGNVSIAGSVGNFGMGGEDIGVAIGVEYRKVASQFIPDTALSSGNVVGFNAGNATKGGYDVKEVFAELRVPLIADRPFFERLELNGAVRYSDYSLDAVGGVLTYAGGVEFAPIRDLTFRGQYQRAVRAPNVAELFGGQQQGFPPATDPCSARNINNRTETIRQLCIQSGVPAAAVFTAAVQPNAQIQGVFGGNPNLFEETSDSYTLGAVIRPRFIPRLNITVDAYNITINDTVGAAGGGVNGILDLCFNRIQDINSTFCQLVNRNPSTGAIEAPFLITATNVNQGKLETQGIDLQVDYSQPLNFGLLGNSSKLNFFFLGTYTDKFDVTAVAELPDEVARCDDRFGILICAEPRPAFKWTSRLSYIDGPLTSSVRWRHLSSVRDDDPDTDFTVERIGAYDLIDLSFSVDATDAVSFAFGVNNLFDKKPPLLGDNQEQTNTFPNSFDTLGRDYFVSANVRF